MKDDVTTAMMKYRILWRSIWGHWRLLESHQTTAAALLNSHISEAPTQWRSVHCQTVSSTYVYKTSLSARNHNNSLTVSQNNAAIPVLTEISPSRWYLAHLSRIHTLVKSRLRSRMAHNELSQSHIRRKIGTPRLLHDNSIILLLCTDTLWTVQSLSSAQCCMSNSLRLSSTWQLHLVITIRLI